MTVKKRRTALKRLREPKPDPWLCGYACAMGAVAMVDNGAVRRAMVGNGVTVAHLEAAGAEEFDLEPIRKAWK